MTESNDQELLIIPLGGVGEVGKNSTLVEYGTDLLLVDAGVQFPSKDLLGVDLVIPDFSYVLDNADFLRGIVLTHGHEDHLGAVPFLVRLLGVPIKVFAMPLALGLVSNKLREHRVEHLVDLVQLRPGERVPVGQLEIEIAQVAHSIPDSGSVFVRSPAGTAFFTGDFKFDLDLERGQEPDLARLKEIADEGVTVLLSDCVRVDRPGFTPPERMVAENLDRMIGDAEGRVIVTTFASNISRLDQTIRSAMKHGRTVAVAGRSMEQNLRVARDLGYLSFDWERLVTLDQANRLPPNKVVLLITGSQGEPSAVMSRISVGDHRQISIQPGDLVIFSATAVPGNENTVARTIDNLMRRGANVLYPPVTQGIHVSGHACSDELKLMIDTLRPEFCVPVHGEYRQMVMYSNLAVESGVPAENVVLSDIGDVIAFRDGGWDKSTRVDAGRVFIDGRTIGDVTGGILRDRRHLAEDGVVVAALAVDRETGELLGGPDLVSRGFMYPTESPILTAAAESLRASLERDYAGPGHRGNFARRTGDLLRRYIYNETRRRPLIVPVVTEV